MMINKKTELKKLYDNKAFLMCLSHYAKLSKEEIVKESIQLDQILYKYFLGKEYCKVTEKQILSNSPIEFINAIRVTKLFLNDDNSYKRLKEYDYGVHSKHLVVWDYLRRHDIQISSKIQTEFENVKGLSTEEVFAYLIYWIETIRNNDGSKGCLHQLSSAYNYFIEFYFSQVDIKDIKEEEFHKIFIQLYLRIKEHKLNPLENLLNSILDWVYINDNVIQEYCYDLSIDIVVENGVLYFNQTPSGYYKWKFDGVRYSKNRFSYQKKSFNIITEEINKKKLYFPDDISSHEMFLEGYFKQCKMNLFLQDLCVDSIDWLGQKGGFFNVFVQISAFSHNKYYRYQKPMNTFKEQGLNWSQSYHELVKLNGPKNIDFQPFLLIKTEKYNELVSNSKLGFNDEFIQKSFKFLSHNYKKKKFNRFKINYDVMQKPFLGLGGFYFCPIAFFANNDWFYSAYQSMVQTLNMNSNKGLQRKNAEKIELYLTEKFSKNGFDVKHTADANVFEGNGDVDIIVKDKEETVLLIQLKRTYLRTDLRSAYDELVNIDRKARKQLNLVEKFLMSENDYYQLDSKPIKWYVSTSFENVNRINDGCNKINYFDLLLALDKGFKTLSEIVTYLEQDFNMLDMDENSDYDVAVFKELGLPLELVEPSDYRKAIVQLDKKQNGYYDDYDKALGLSNKGSNIEAIEVFKKCLNVSPNDVDVLGNIANCYANIRDFDNLKKYFEKALEITPNEPYTKRNYALALIENNKIDLGNQLLFELYKDYTHVGDFHYLMNKVLENSNG